MSNKRIVREDNMISMIWGGTLLGGGGGGPLSAGVALIDAFKRDHPEAEIAVTMIPHTEMAPGEYAAATAGMGAPAAIVGVDFSKFANNAFNLLKEVAARYNQNLKYNIAVELGGFSSAFPLLLSMISKIENPENEAYTIDADGAGRAVPALETLLLHVNGCPTAPIALANGDNDKIVVELADPHNAPLAEKIGRDICGEFGNMVGISGWLVDGKDIEEKIVTGSMTLTEKIGDIMRKSTCADDAIFEELAANGLLENKVVCKGTVLCNKGETRNGFDFGAVDVLDDATGVTYRINYQNENLLLQKKLDDGNYEDMMTVPDITCMYCIDPAGHTNVTARMPLSNADTKEGMKVAVAVAKVDPKWFKTETTWWDVWSECMKHIGYEGGHIGYDNVK